MLLKCNPPPISKRVEEKLPPEKAFVNYVLFDFMDEQNVNEALRFLRKMNWNDPDMALFIRRSFMRVASYSIEFLFVLVFVF